MQHIGVCPVIVYQPEILLSSRPKRKFLSLITSLITFVTITHVIAVDLSAEENISYEKKKLPTAWKFIKSRFRSKSFGPEIPTLHNVILQSTMLGSRREVINTRRLADLFFESAHCGV